MVWSGSRQWSRWLRTSCLSVLIGSSVHFVAAPVVAAPDEFDRSAARETARRGLEAYEQKRYSDAFELFERAESVVHAPTHLLYLARSSVALGRLVRARETYLKLTREVLPADAPAAFRDAQQSASTELAALEPRIPRLMVELQGVAAAEVTLDGRPIPMGLVGVAVPVDPGEHQVEGRAANMKPVSLRLDVAESAEQRATLVFVAAAEAAGSPPTSPATLTSSTRQNETSPKGNSTLRLASYGAAGVGLVGLGLGTYFIVRAGSKSKDADDLYGKYDCPNCSAKEKQEVIDLDDSAASAKTMGAVGFIVGGVGVAAAATLFVLSTRQSDGGPRTGFVTPYVGPNELGVVGSF